MTNKVQFAREDFVSIYPEMLPLLIQQYNETSWNTNKVKFEPDVEKYTQLDDFGVLFCFSARVGGELIGYASFLLSSHLHYKSVMFASNDVIFIAQQYRGRRLAADFLNFCAEELKAFGAQVITVGIKDQLDWSSLTKSIGFESVESTHLKWIGD